MDLEFLQGVTQRVVLKAYLSSDHISAATGKTIAVVISKNGGAFGNPSVGATNATEIASGWYYVDLSTTDTGTLGPLVVRGTAATVDDVEKAFNIVKATNRGSTALPDAVAAAAGGLLTFGTGSGQLTATSGAVTAGTVSDKTGYSLNLTQAIPTSNTAQTVGDALNAARAQGFGKWVLSGTTLTLYAGDGTTVARTFTLDSATAPSQRV